MQGTARRRTRAALRRSIASIGSGSTPCAAASSSETRSPSITAQSRRSVRLSPAASTRTAVAAVALDLGRGQLEAAAARAGAGRGPRACTAAAGRSPGALPAADLVVVGLGQLREEGRQLRVLVDLGLPAPGDAARSGRRRRRPAARPRARRRSRRRGARRSSRLLSRKPAAASISAAMRGAAPASGGDLDARRRACRRRRRAAGRMPGQADHRHAGRARALDQGAAGAGDDAAGAERLGGLEAGERLLGLARVARAEHRPLGARPSSAARSRAPSAAAG